MKRVVILQSNYIPWLGYFDLMRRADVFVLYDHVQYTKNDWRNRNRIKTPQGVNWLTIPVRQTALSQTILETEVSQPNWWEKHLRTLHMNYAKAPHYKQHADELAETYRLAGEEQLLSQINFRFLKLVAGWLGIETEFRWSTEFELAEDRVQRLVDICKALNANTYLSGPSAKAYLTDHAPFETQGIDVQWMAYPRYPAYAQLHGAFEYGLSALDVVMCAGAQEASRLLRVADEG